MDNEELLVELIRHQGSEIKQVIESLRELREDLDNVRASQVECQRILSQYKGAFRVVGMVAGLSATIAAAWLSIKYK